MQHAVEAEMMGEMECHVAKEVSLAHLIRLIGQLLAEDMTRVFIPTYTLVTKFYEFLPVSHYVLRNSTWTMHC